MARSLTKKIENGLFFVSKEFWRSFSGTANKYNGILLPYSNFLSLVDIGLATIKYRVVFGYSFITGLPNDNYFEGKKRRKIRNY